MNIIDSDSDLQRLADRLSGADLLAADTEAAGFHRYDDNICLLQLTADENTFLIDTLAISDLEPLRPLLVGPATEVIFHDADYDLRLLDRDFGITIGGLFDTKIAAQLLGVRKLGLGNLLESFLGVQVAKKYQRADWARRPLPEEMLAYATEDTKHLAALRERLKAELTAKGRLHWAEEEFREVEGTRWEESDDDPAAFLQVKGIGDLGPRQLAGLRELYAWREKEGRRRDRATFRVLPREAMIEMARFGPRNLAHLQGIKGVSKRMVDEHGEELLEAVDRARHLPDSELPAHPERPPRPPRPPVEVEERIERLKQVRGGCAKRLELDRGFMLPRWQIEKIALAAPRSLEELQELPSVRRWQVEAFGEDILAAI